MNCINSEQQMVELLIMDTIEKNLSIKYTDKL